MAKDTKIIVTIPGDFQGALTDYIFTLQDVGVRISKSQAIIQLARIGYAAEILHTRVRKDEGYAKAE